MVQRSIRMSSIALLLCLGLLMPPANLFAQAVNSDGVVDAAAVNASNQLVVFDVNRNVTTKDRGFPRNDPPMSAANGNWKTPVNFAEGTFYYRIEIRNQPVAQNMRVQFCIWQDKFHLENCGSQKSLTGRAGTVVTWSQPVQGLWKKGGKIIDWSRARQRYGIAIKNSRGKPVSDYNGWRWNGENPRQWYPLNMRFTVVVVAKGASFGGWQNYGGSASDNALIDDSTVIEGTVDAANSETEDADIIVSEDGETLDFGSGMDFDLWESESATDAPDIDQDIDQGVDQDIDQGVDQGVDDLTNEALENKLYLPMISS